MKRITYNHKKRSWGLAGLMGLMGLSLTSCSDFLVIDPLNEIVMEQFWNEKADVDGIVAGCYSAMQNEGVIRRMMVWGEFRSDNVGLGQNTSKDNDLLSILNENITSKNGYTTWVDFYNVINRCNTVIKYAPGVAATDPAYTQSELQAHIAEVSALRDLCYFYLIRAFRDVPYTTEAYTDDDQVMDLPATKFDVVLDSLINDLESVKGMAVKRYPTTKPLYQMGRITQDAIYAMLCEMYLWKKDYQNCIKYADLVIESKKAITEENRRSGNSGYGQGSNTLERFNGFPLVSESRPGSSSGSYGDAYRTLFGSDSNPEEAVQEIIFSLIFDDNLSGNGMIANGAVNTFYGNDETPIGFVAPSEYLLEDIEKASGRNVFADRNKKLDARMYEACNIDNTSVAKYVVTSVSINVSNSATNPTPSWSGYYGKDRHGSNWIIYRLTDIMLLKAEALAQTLREGTDQETLDYNTPILDEAFTLVNAINKRAVCQTTLIDTLVAGDYGTKAQMETLVMQERQRELLFEGKRWFDLVRKAQRDGNTSQITAAAIAKATTNAAQVQNKLTKMDAIYWPYNYDELKVNKNLVQNPAFSSGESSYESTY